MKKHKKKTLMNWMRVKVDGTTYRWFPTDHLTLDGKKRQILKNHETTNPKIN